MLHTHFTRFGSITGRTEQVDPGRGNQGSGVAEYFTRYVVILPSLKILKSNVTPITFHLS